MWRFADGVERSVREPRPPVRPVRIDVNRAPPAELRLLPGFGPTRARALVLERLRGGWFRDLDDLQRVPGVGPETLRRIADFVDVSR